ncbi:MAG: hypothetical protein JWM12_3553, partial [Ilumatobacteraceae bacterium]|nr:hypothetical protein [Ilumatobacteraceae bacterium]
MRTGFDGTSMDDVARAAGVTRLIVYRIFESKHDLYTAVLDEVVEDLRRQFAPFPRPGDVAVMVLGVARRHPDGFRLLWRHAAHEPEFAAWAASFREVVYELTEARLAERMADAVLRHWAARAIVGY